MVGSSSTNKVGGMYRNLMMPGFTDAGAGTAYVPKAAIPRRTAATTNESPGSTGKALTKMEASSNAVERNVDAALHSGETFSEAGTELHDNRTNKHSVNSMASRSRDRDRYYPLKTGVVSDGGKNDSRHEGRSNTNNNDQAANTTSSNDSTEVEANFGFFPSTKPPPSPSPRGNAGALAAGETPKRGTKHPTKPLSPSPQPLSPPPVTRKQMVASKRAEDDKNQNTTKPGTKKTTTLEKDENDDADQDDKNEPYGQQFPLQGRSFEIRRGMMKREVSTFSLAPETGAVVEREENQAKLKQWKERENPSQKIDEEDETEIESGGDDLPKDTENSDGDIDDIFNNERSTERRLDLSALQEIDRMEGQKISKGNDELSTSSSIVSSTCSEFGTVIQLGEAAMAARMKEVEEMELTALEEVPSNEEHDSGYPSKTAPELSSTSLLQHDNSSGKNATVNKKSDVKTTVAAANSTISPMKRNPTKSEMVSAAFRRIGPIHNLNNTTTLLGEKKVRSSLSAPTTPMRVQTFDHSKQQTGTLVQGQESSPSRFETASDVAGDKKSRILSPRFASFLRARGHGDTNSSSTKPKAAPTARAAPQLSPRVAISQTFQYAQKCFANDKTLIENGSNDNESDVDFYSDVNLYNIDERRRKLKDDLVIPPLGGRPTTARLAPRVLPLESSSSFLRSRKGVGNFAAGLRPSQSLDYSTTRRSPFRELPSSTSQRNAFLHHSFPAPPKEDATTMSVSGDIDLRGRINSDFSPSKISTKTMSLNSTMELHQPQRIEIEREDALDILACLVEQGIAGGNTSIKIENLDPDFINKHDKEERVENHEESTPDIMETTKEEKTDECMPGSEKKAVVNDILSNDHSDSDDLHKLIGDFKKWIENQDEEGKGTKTRKRHQRERRTKLLQDLIKSHAYAVDMKRASASASTWLKSIGRGQGTSEQEILVAREKSEEENCTSMTTDIEKIESSKADDITTTNDKMEMLTLKATLHSAQLELTETKEQNSRLNEELSKCRAEIGRIKSISRNDRISKSILDDSSETSLSETRSKDFLTKDASKIDSTYESFLQDAPSHEERSADHMIKSDLIAFQSALNKANDTIRRLHNDLRRKEGLEDEGETEAAPIVDVPAVQVTKDESQPPDSTPDSNLRTPNVHMLDGENFVTDWSELKTLPPPPDHNLQSPIVSAILEQWTQDRSLHESLFLWMDNVMKDDDLEDLPPLDIKGLDHQVRDGFTMHVLPHLLRRADIHVAVRTRSHRQTKYDMSVTVSQKKEGMVTTNSQQHLSLLDRRDSMSGDEWMNRFEPRFSSTESVAHSAVTEAITNHSSTKQNQQGLNDAWDRPPQTPVQTEYSEFSSQFRSRSGSTGSYEESPHYYRQRQSEQSQGTANGGTIMGALGGALSGLLSRNKYAVSPGRSQASQARFHGTEDSRTAPNMLPASLRAQMDLTSSPTPGSNRYHRAVQLESTLPASIDDRRQINQEEPYHRVVSAPPGRIGLTFVEYRGHAVVSDVAADSPLADWVFPSDILIAIDEIPVSGMRVRDIVTIISDRKSRQRALRVMSSHDMNEFTMMSQVVGPLNEETGENE